MLLTFSTSNEDDMLATDGDIVGDLYVCEFHA